MLKISSSEEYGTRIMVRLADPAVPTLNAQQLSVMENIPRNYVDQILLRLRRSELITSQRGANGGYRLAAAAEKISVGQIMRAVDQAIFESVCDRYAQGEQQCQHTSVCGIRPVWQRLSELVQAFLNQVMVSDLCQQEENSGVRIAQLFSNSLKGVLRATTH